MTATHDTKYLAILPTTLTVYAMRAMRPGKQTRARTCYSVVTAPVHRHDHN